jgi:hypothetical protein
MRRPSVRRASNQERTPAVERCLSCQYYDRQIAKDADGKATQWGQCRRSAPALSPINAKSYMIEGVWPTVRDDDWCGEWKTGGVRKPEPRVGDLLNAALTANAGNTQPALQPRIVPRPASPATLASAAPTARAAVGGAE